MPEAGLGQPARIQGSVPWTARRSNQSILKEISPGCSLEGMMLKLKLQYVGHLTQLCSRRWPLQLETRWERSQGGVNLGCTGRDSARCGWGAGPCCAPGGRQYGWEPAGPIPPSIRVFSNESTLRMRWPKYSIPFFAPPPLTTPPSLNAVIPVGALWPKL